MTQTYHPPLLRLLRIGASASIIALLTTACAHQPSTPLITQTASAKAVASYLTLV